MHTQVPEGWYESSLLYVFSIAPEVDLIRRYNLESQMITYTVSIHKIEALVPKQYFIEVTGEVQRTPKVFMEYKYLKDDMSTTCIWYDGENTISQ